TLSHPAAPSLTMVLAADLHCRSWKKGLPLLAQIRPDIIVSSGDMMHNCETNRVDDPFNLPGLTFLAEAAEIAPVYLSIGNHEKGMMPGNREILAERGITLLDNEWVSAHGMHIGGLSSTIRCGYKRTDETPLPDTDFLARFAAEDGFHLLLNHHPEFWPSLICGTGIQLTLSGHAHGGQWHLFGHDIWSPGQGLFPKYASGIHRSAAGETLIVSRGMANTVKFAPRFGNPTELVVVRLTGGKDAIL
ncbi:MAG: metallophosphoesterase, partial [Clostridia bacterium]|nr:metallophosphoesterase [Clostridia bacterium]